VSHTGAADCFNERFLNDAVFDVEAEFARALLGSAPADAVREAADVLNFLSLNPFAFLGDGSGTVVGTFCYAAHFVDFA
jgi:hypothetical protein